MQNPHTPQVRCNHAHTDAVPEGELLAPGAERVDDPDHLVTGHDGQARQLEIALDDVQVGAAAPARVDAHAGPHPPRVPGPAARPG